MILGGTKPDRGLNRHVLVGMATLAVLAGGLFGWATTTELSGAVVAQGVVVVESNVKKVQHPSGGIVSELNVRDGDRVAAGMVLMRLDETITRANLAIVSKSLNELAARQARLEAERDGAERIELPAELLAQASQTEVARAISAETKLFEFRQSARSGQKAQLRERIAQLREELVGLGGQAVAKQREIELILRELEGVRDLWSKNLIPISRVTALEREAVRLEGERNQLTAMSAQGRGKVAEIELQIIQIEQDLRSEVARELREIQAKAAELVERKVAADDQLRRTEIRGPQDGIVHQLSVHTIGGVITASEPVMLIVPESDQLSVETRVLPQDIDQIAIGQHAALRFSAFNSRTTPEITGIVTRISADTAQDRIGAAFYVVRIALPQTELARLDKLKLLPGMPVEVFIRTEVRSVMSYLVKPLQEQAMRAFRER